MDTVGAGARDAVVRPGRSKAQSIGQLIDGPIDPRVCGIPTPFNNTYTHTYTGLPAARGEVVLPEQARRVQRRRRRRRPGHPPCRRVRGPPPAWIGSGMVYRKSAGRVGRDIGGRHDSHQTRGIHTPSPTSTRALANFVCVCAACRCRRRTPSRPNGAPTAPGHLAQGTPAQRPPTLPTIPYRPQAPAAGRGLIVQAPWVGGRRPRIRVECRDGPLRAPS